MSLAPYPKYRPSGIEWLGEVPEHWVLRRSDAMIEATRRQIDREAFSEREVLHYSIPAVQEQGAGTIQHGSEIESGKQVVSDSVVLVSRLNPRKSTICRAAPHRHLLTIASVEFVALRPVSTEIGFLFYLMQSELVRQRLDSGVQSVTRSHQRVDADHIRRFWHVWPPKGEQRVISAFLDWETAKLDAVVRKQQTLIERLREKRSALITETVTRGLPPDAARAAGLDPNPPRKPSAVEWLGDLPAHWETKRLKYLASINDESLPDTTDSDFEMSYVDIGGVDAVKGIVESEPMTFGGAPSRARRIARDGDSIVSTVRTYLRAIAPVRGAPDDLIVSTGFAVVRPRALCPAYLSYAVRESRFVEAVVARSVGVSYPAVNASEIGRIVIPAPPDGEQQAIADYLDRETAKLDALVAKIETAIERLREYRSAIITAAVTGKVDVHSARRPAPAERGLPNRARRS